MEAGASLVKNDESLKTITLKWEDEENHPNYQVQILRLMNEGNEITDEYESIEVTFDNEWESALTLTTDGSEKEIQVTLGEGTGFYVARIRPLGTYYEGGISDFRNYG